MGLYYGVVLVRDSNGVYVTNKGAKASEIGKRFRKGDYYRNDKTGDKYICTKDTQFPKPIPSKRYTADWKYVSTDILRVPQSKPTNLTIKKNSDMTFQVSWKVPSGTTSSTNNARAEKTKINVYAQTTAGRKTLYISQLEVGTTSFSINKPQFFSNELYPKKDVKISSLYVEVFFWNQKGNSLVEIARYYFKEPRVPDAFSIAHDANTGRLSATIKTNAGTDQYNRRDTVYTITVFRSKTGSTEVVRGENTSTSFTVSKDIQDRQQIEYGQYIRTTISAWARGIAGTSTSSRVKQYVMSFPNIPNVTVPKLTRTPNSGRAVFGIKLQSTAEFPVTGVRFQKLVSVDYNKASDIPADASWENVGPQDNGACTAMSLAVEDLLPAAGKKTWVRAKSWNDIESIFYRYSNPLRLTALETPAPVEPSAADDNATILSCSLGSDKTSAQLLVAWAKVGGRTDDSNWTEISWADSEKAWKSTEQPKTFTFADATWNEGQVTQGNVTYAKSAHIDIMGLNPSTKYYISARRVLIPQEGETTYGPYCTKKTITTPREASVVEATTVTALSARDVIRGEAIPLSWSYDGDAVQESWSIRKMSGATKSSTDLVLARANDDRRFYNLSYWRDKNHTSPIVSSSTTSVTIYVECKVSGTYISSEPVTVGLLDKPTFELAVSSRVTTQPLSVNLFTNDPNSNASIVVESLGISDSKPDGDCTQSDGDTIWSGTVTPTWGVVSSIGEQAAVETAKDALDAAQEDYDDVMEQYEEAKGRMDSAQATISVLEDKIADETRDLSDAQADLAAYQTRLANMSEGDPMYEQAVADVESATERVSALQSSIESDSQAIEEARDALENENGYQRGIAELTAKGHAEQDGTPTPENPVPIQVVRWRNLAKPYVFSDTVNNVTFDYRSDGSVHLSGTAGSDAVSPLISQSNTFKITLDAGTYIPSLIGGKSGIGINVQNYDSNSQLSNGGGFTLTATTNVIVRVSVASGTVTNCTVLVQLEKGSTPTPYVPYGHVGMEARDPDTDELISCTALPLPSRGWVGSLPDGTADSLRLDGAGKVEWTEQTDKATFDGDETFELNNSGKRVITDLPNARPVSSTSEVSSAFSTHFIATTPVSTWNGTLGFAINNASSRVSFSDGTGSMTVTDWKTWLSTHPVTVLYPLATPVTEDCGYVESPVIPAHATVSIPELDEVGVKYTFNDGGTTAALESAMNAYAAAVSNAIGPSSNTGYTHEATVQIGDAIDIRDNGEYMVIGFVTDRNTNVSSDKSEAKFEVSWAHQAPTPSPDITVEGYDSTDADGRRTIGTTVELPEPPRAFLTDVYDLYRVSRDGVSLALSGIPYDSTVNDPYAPFGINQNGYVVACRTVNGDIDWMTYDYMLAESEVTLRSMVRIDWADKYLELDRGVSPTDSFEKDFVTHKHLDGSVSGHWNKGIMRTMSISATLVRGYEARQEELLRELARYDGPCLVRTTDGVFLEANVTVDGIGFSNRTVRGDVSLKITEIRQTGTFAPTIVEE